jgi:hypothetical protein
LNLKRLNTAPFQVLATQKGDIIVKIKRLQLAIKSPPSSKIAYFISLNQKGKQEIKKLVLY